MIMDIENAYQASLDYLYSFVDFSLTRGFVFSPDKFDLGRMFDLMQALGNPHMAYPVIHIAGTKGKGSVSALCASALQAGGYRVGLYTSPHLHDYTERIQVNGSPMTHAELVSLVEELKPFVASIPALTTFEITTALGLLYFARQGVNAAVVEVGLGGRLDATNVVSPLVSVITSISYDHMNVLGDTLEKIATEKAGIIKPGVPVVIAPQKETARQVLAAIAGERHAPLVQVGIDFLFSRVTTDLERGQTFSIWRAGGEPASAGEVPGIPEEAEMHSLEIPLLGAHQVDNAATAYTALVTAAEQGLSIDQKAIFNGFCSVRWPARFEILRREPPLVVDSAHNRDSCMRLRMTLDENFPGMPGIVIFGASEDKDIEGMLAELAPRIDQLIVTRSFHPRAMEPVQLLEIANRLGIPALVFDKVEQALPEALQLAGKSAFVLAAGSLFIAAAVREVWLSSKN